MGKVYWEENGKMELIEENLSSKDYVFTANLRLIYNKLKNKGTKMIDVFAIPKSPITFYEIKTEDTIYREIEGIESKKALKICKELLSIGRKRKMSYSDMKCNLPKMAYAWARAVIVDRKKGEDKEIHLLHCSGSQICRHKETMYKAFTSAYLNGYSFNVADPNKVYTDVYSFDYKSNHNSLIYSKEFPWDMVRKDVSNYGKDKDFYGYFEIIVKKDDPYLYKFCKFYNSEEKIIIGWFNNIDLEFIEKLCGIADIKCLDYWEVKVRPTGENLRRGIEILFNLAQEAKGAQRKIIKLSAEKIYGESVKRRRYDKSYVWNVETQQLELVDIPYNWKEVQQKLYNNKESGIFDYSMGVWVCSYARLRLLKLRKELEAVGCEVLYGDIDCIKFRGEQGLRIIEQINSKRPANFDLGKLKFENKSVKFKVLDFKWYCGIDEEGNLTTATAGANTEVVGNWLKSLPNPVESFTKDFPPEVKPFKKRIWKPDGSCKEVWSGSVKGFKKDLYVNSTVVMSCAGSGKTTTLVENVKKLIPTGEPITVIAFTNKNVEELKERIGRAPNLEIRTIDSLAASFLDNQIDGDNFQLKLETATEWLIKDPTICRASHLFVDEFQDLDMPKFNFIRALPVLSRFFIGDPNQSIYGYSGAIDLFGKLTDFQIEKRTTNYRCGQIINDYAEGFLDEKKRPHATCIDKGGEVRFIQVEDLAQLNCVVLCRTNNQIEILQKRFPQLTYLTIHKAKGLTFDEVAVVGIEERKETSEEQNIAYVAATRPRKILYVVRGEINGI